MVKFLCTRQTSAERLGVQSLGFHGYLVLGVERLGDAEELLPEGGEGPEELATTGQMLLNKTLFFIQQLTRDMVGAPPPKQGLWGQAADCIHRLSPSIMLRALDLYTRPPPPPPHLKYSQGEEGRRSNLRRRLGVQYKQSRKTKQKPGLWKVSLLLNNILTLGCFS